MIKAKIAQMDRTPICQKSAQQQLEHESRKAALGVQLQVMMQKINQAQTDKEFEREVHNWITQLEDCLVDNPTEK